MRFSLAVVTMLSASRAKSMNGETLRKWTAPEKMPRESDRMRRIERRRLRPKRKSQESAHRKYPRGSNKLDRQWKCNAVLVCYYVTDTNTLAAWRKEIGNVQQSFGQFSILF